MAQAQRTSTSTEVLAGLVERIMFHNTENGFCVLRVRARGQRDLITVLGHAAMISAGEFVQARRQHAISATVQLPDNNFPGVILEKDVRTGVTVEVTDAPLRASWVPQR